MAIADKKSRELLNAKFATFELSKIPIKKGRNRLLSLLRPVLRGVRDYIRTEMREKAN